MGREVERHNWPGYFKEFNERNRWRLSELQLREGEGVPQIERDLSLSGITVKVRGKVRPKSRYHSRAEALARSNLLAPFPSSVG